MLPTHPGTNWSEFTKVAREVINDSHDVGCNYLHRTGVSRPHWEPHFVAHLCAHIPKLATEWGKLLQKTHHGYKLNATSIFTHQKPYVKWNSGTPKRCELADLLIAIIDRKQRHGYAIVIQAKQADGAFTKLKNESEKRQYELLSTRPLFSIDETSAPVDIDLSGLRPDNALLYGLNPPSSQALPRVPYYLSFPAHRWTTAQNLQSATPRFEVKGNQCLSETITAMLHGSQGWRFELPPAGQTWTHFETGGSTRDEWSLLINYLLENTFSHRPDILSRIAPSGAAPTRTRGNEENMYFMATPPNQSPRLFFTSTGNTMQRPLDWLSASNSNMNAKWEQYDHDWYFPWIHPFDRIFHGDNNPPNPPDDHDGEFKERSGPISAICIEISKGE